MAQVPYLVLASDKYEILHPFHRLSAGINLVGSETTDSLRDLQLPGKVNRLGAAAATWTRKSEARPGVA